MPRLTGSMLACGAASAALIAAIGWATAGGASTGAPTALDGQAALNGQVALDGQVASAQEGAMEGVVVSATRDGSPITISVISDDKGHYAFPADRLQPGHYTLAIRAAGYDLKGEGAADIRAGGGAHADLPLVPTQDLASQLSSAEWMLSAPGTETQRNLLLNCAECHTLQLPMMSGHTKPEFEGLIQRMLGAYAYQSQVGDHQLMPQPRHLDPAQVKQMADYLASINLGSGSQFQYPLKTLPRVKGRGTHVIITEYDLGRPLAQPHDVIVDPSGTVWYDDFSKQIIGRLDPKTGKTEEYKVPLLRPGRPTGLLAIENGLDGKLWLALHLQAGIASFDPRTKQFRVYPVPDSLMQPNMQTSQLAVANEAVDGKVWTSAGADTATRVDVASGKYEQFHPFADLAKSGALSAKAEQSMPAAGLGGGEAAGTASQSADRAASVGAAGARVIYGMATDSHNNFYGMSFLGRSILRVDAKTGGARSYDTVTPFSQPRRGQMDAMDRLWFAQFNANRITMLDTTSGKIVDYEMRTPFTAPYDAILDKNGYAWTGGMNTDRVVRVNVRTGEQIEYQLPKTTNIRRVFVDNHASRPVFWVGSNHGASIIKVEPLD